jgi:diguanylate cyclase (GGDEF)-like protein
MATQTILPAAEFDAALEALDDRLPLAIAITDIDYFQDVNETYGRAAGDAVLRSFERTLGGSLPRDALVGRISGDSYAVALPELSAESALIVLEEIRVHFSAHEVEGVPKPVHLSIGVAARPPHATTVGDLMRAADEALSRAKREGRGRVAIYVEDKMTLKSNYYAKGMLNRLSKLSSATGRTEASLLREALEDLLAKHRSEL